MPRQAPRPTHPEPPSPASGSTNMKDIARALGISASTVSLALAGRPSVAEATRRLVLEKAEALGYRKNPLVAALMQTRRRGRPASSGNVVAYFDFHAGAKAFHHAGLPDYFAGCAAEAERLGLRLERFHVFDPTVPERRLCDILRARGIQGVILGPCPVHHYKPDFDWNAFCWISMTVSLDAPPLDLVNSDHFGDTHHALLQAQRLGYRKAAILMSKKSDDRLRRAWLGAYLAHVGDVNPDGPLEPYRTNDFDPKTFQSWFHRNQPDVIISTINPINLSMFENIAPPIPDKLGIICATIPQQDEVFTGYRENWPVMEIEAVRHLYSKIMRGDVGVPAVPRLLRIPGTWNPGHTARPQAGTPGREASFPVNSLKDN